MANGTARHVTGIPVIRDLPDDPTVWADDAACREVGVGAFFSELQGKSVVPEYKAAQRICAGCSVRGECLEYAMSIEPFKHDERYGVWGGLTPHGRERLARARRRQAA